MPTRPTIVKDDKSALVVGCEGFVGEHLVKLLGSHQAYKRIYLVSQRKPTKIDADRIWINESLGQLNFQGKQVDDLFICYDASFFNAGGKYSIDKSNYKYFPRIVIDAYRSGVSQVLLLSSSTANPEGLLFSYRIRGLIEQSVKKMGFWGAHIFRPSILIGETTGEQWGQKLADQIGNRFDRFTGGWLRKNRPIEAHVVARAMLEKAQTTTGGSFTYSPAWLQDYASSIKKTDITKR